MEREQRRLGGSVRPRQRYLSYICLGPVITISSRYMRKVEVGHVPRKSTCTHAARQAQILSVHFDLNLVAIRIAQKGRQSLAPRSVIHLRLAGLKAPAFQCGDDVINA